MRHYVKLSAYIILIAAFSAALLAGAEIQSTTTLAINHRVFWTSMDPDRAWGRPILLPYRPHRGKSAAFPLGRCRNGCADEFAHSEAG